MIFSSRRITRLKLFLALAVPLWALAAMGCSVKSYTPPDLSQLNSPVELGIASRKAYQQSKAFTDKELKLQQAQAGIQYAEKCLKKNPEEPACLYFHALNTGQFISLHHPNYQRGLKKMVADCNALIKIEPGYEEAGCYRILGNVYAKAPAFSLLPEKNVTQDLDKSATYLREAVRIAPQNPFNHLFLAQTLWSLGDKAQAKQELLAFDSTAVGRNLDLDFPEWKKERNELARKLLPQEPKMQNKQTEDTNFRANLNQSP